MSVGNPGGIVESNAATLTVTGSFDVPWDIMEGSPFGP
jgi:hypothetical protein